ncbi:type II toxin-antitoxin system VapC family toxin [Candidatus Jidaibacter acanthamoebae]|nr:type II toxin-antitoxin system VapC family toxin [Candidatus Jidaibacter acanthamoeba]
MEDNKNIILDASALIALLGDEKGCEVVEDLLPYAIMSSVNIAEVARFLVSASAMEIDKIQEVIDHLVPSTVPFDNKYAYITANMLSQTKALGLSLGDRACLALAIITGYPVYTADKIWEKLEIENLKVHLIR